MSKYIIDIPKTVGTGKVGSVHYTYFDGIQCQTIILKSDEIEELNSDYINEHYGGLQDEAYQRGLDDAWEAAKKIFGYEMDGGIPIDEIGKVFGYAEGATFCTADILRHNTAIEAIEKLKAYEEQKADDEIKVGDEVNWSSDCFIVTRIFQPRNMKEQCDGIDDDGCVYSYVLMDDLEKTGRHFDILSILKEMQS